MPNTKSSTSSIIRSMKVVFVVSTLLLLVSITASFISIRRLIESVGWVSHTYEVLVNSEKILSSLREAESNQRGYIITQNDDMLKEYKKAHKSTWDHFSMVKKLISDNSYQKRNLDSLEEKLSMRFLHMENILSRIADNEKNRAELFVKKDNKDLLKGKMLRDKINILVFRIKEQENELLGFRQAELNNYTGFTPILLIISAIISLAITLISYIRIKKDLDERAKKQKEDEELYRKTSSRINIMESVTQKIAQGDYAVRSLDEDEDDLGRISKGLNKMTISLEHNFNALKNKDWLQVGAANISDAIRSEREITLLTSNILNSLTSYLKSPIATMYINHTGVFTLASSYSILNAPKQFLLGEGLIGQAAINQKISVVDQLPPDFLISSSLGNTLPVSMVIVPLIYENETIAIIEIGLLRKPDALEIEFLENNREAMAIGVYSALSYVKLQNLLEETQVQTEELQSQHNELENLNSELEAQSQQLQASEEELKVQQEELQQINEELEERTVLLEESNKDVRRKAEELELTTRYKSEFLANMSHELRTPLNSILLLSRLLTDNHEKNLSEDQIEYAKVIQSSGNGLLGLIDEILDLSKIEAGKMTLEYLDVSVSEIVEDLTALFKPVAQNKNLDFQIMLDQDTPGIIETDKVRLEQILKNLLSNALKFTAQGSIRLEIKPCVKTPGFICFIVKDTGIGIPKEKQPLVFEAFQQADGSTKRKYGGTGLGLSISRELVKLLGGDILLESKVNEGSVFTLRVPVRKEEELALSNEQLFTEKDNGAEFIEKIKVATDKYVATEIPQSIPDDRLSITPADKVILIIEDDTNFAKSLQGFAGTKGYKTVVAVRGDEGLSYAKKYNPIGILLDIQLPVKSGWDVMDELKSDSQTRHIPVHMMSSYQMKNESLLRGAIDFINKPFAQERMQDVFKKIEYVLNRDSKKVLIVEDNPKHAKALAYFLETFHIISEVKSNITDSLSSLKKDEVDCVILDMGIPDQKSYELLEEAKKNPGFEHLPIIIFTGKSLSVSEEQRIKQYADSIVVKTAHSYQRMLDEVSLFLHLVEEKKKPSTGNDYRKLGVLNEILNNKTVLIVDDDVRNIFSLSKAMESLKMNIITAVDGKEALEKLKANPSVNVVLLDMMMPELDGYETAKQIRSNHAWRNLPIIAVTAKAMTGDREKCIQAGASDYITKPVDIDQLLSLLRVWLYEKK